MSFCLSNKILFTNTKIKWYVVYNIEKCIDTVQCLMKVVLKLIDLNQYTTEYKTL